MSGKEKNNKINKFYGYIINNSILRNEFGITFEF